MQNERGVQGTARERARRGNKGEGAEDNGCWGRANEESVRRGDMLGMQGGKGADACHGNVSPSGAKNE